MQFRYSLLNHWERFHNNFDALASTFHYLNTPGLAPNAQVKETAAECLRLLTQSESVKSDLERLCDMLRPLRMAINVLQADDAVLSDVYFTLHPIISNIHLLTPDRLPSEIPDVESVINIHSTRLEPIITDAHVRSDPLKLDFRRFEVQIDDSSSGCIVVAFSVQVFAALVDPTQDLRCTETELNGNNGLLHRAKSFIRTRLSSPGDRTQAINGLEKFIAVRGALLQGIVRQSKATTADPGSVFDLEEYVSSRIESVDTDAHAAYSSLIITSAERRMGIIHWWATSDARFLFGDKLPDIAGYTLTMPPTTASTERLFSALGMRVSTVRNQTKVDNAVNQLKVPHRDRDAATTVCLAHSETAL